MVEFYWILFCAAKLIPWHLLGPFFVGQVDVALLQETGQQVHLHSRPQSDVGRTAGRVSRLGLLFWEPALPFFVLF